MFCTNCGKEIESTWVRCPYCGNEVEKEDTSEEIVQQKIDAEKANANEEGTQNINPSPQVAPNFNVPSGDRVKYRSFWKYLLLSCITFGIYGIYVMYGYVKDLNKVCEGDGKQSKNYIVVFLLTIVTFGIYGFYWYYTQGERLYRIAPKYGVYIREKGGTILTWMILGCTVIPGIGALAVTYIMFDNMNLVGKVYNGDSSAEEINRAGKPHPHLVRNVIIMCAVLWIFVIGCFVLFINELFTYDTAEDSVADTSTVEEIEDYSDMDLEEIFEQPEKNLKELGFEGDEEFGEYTLLGGAVYVSCIDGKVYMLMLEGISEQMPSVHGVKTGMTLQEAETLLSDVYTSVGQRDNRFAYLNTETGYSVSLTTEGESVAQIVLMQLSEEEIQEYIETSYIFPDSDKKYLSEEEVRSVEVDRLAIGRNEIFARHGYIFSEDTFKQYFESMAWYKGTVPSDQFNADAVFNDFEKKNVELIKKVEDEINGTAETEQTFIGMTGTYICVSSEEGGFTGRIDINNITGSTFEYSLTTLEMSYSMLNGQAQIVDSQTAQATEGGLTITFTWSDSENIFVTNSGFIGDWMDAAVIDIVTDNQSYTRPLEFNQW